MNKIDFSKVFAAGLRGISRLIIEFSSIEQKTFTKALRSSLANTVRQEYPDKPISYLAHKTGLLSEQVNDALDSDYPVQVMDTESIILSDLWHHRDSNGRVSINGKNIISFYSIAMNQLKGRHSLSSVLDSLIESGSIKKDGDDLVVLSNSFAINQNEERIINQTGLVMNRLIDTVIHNKNSDQNNSKKLYQRSFKSTKVPPSNRGQMHQELYTLFQSSNMPEAREIIEKYEVAVPNGYYPVCGVSMFEFDTHTKQKGENK